MTPGNPALCADAVDFEAELVRILGTHADGAGMRAYADNTTCVQINGEFTSVSNARHVASQVMAVPGAWG